MKGANFGGHSLGPQTHDDEGRERPPTGTLLLKHHVFITMLRIEKSSSGARD